MRIWFVSVLVLIMLSSSGCKEQPVEVNPLPETEYSKIKTLVSTKGTHYSTVILLSSNNQFSGTLVRKDNTAVVITCGHTFKKGTHDRVYWYMLDGVSNSISTVYSHPKSDALGQKDIAFCIPGKPRKIRGFWENTTDTRHSNVSINRQGDMKGVLFFGLKRMTVVGNISSDAGAPLYLIPHKSIDGESGSGFISMPELRFFVIKGNIPESNIDFEQALGVDRNSISVVTEL